MRKSPRLLAVVTALAMVVGVVGGTAGAASAASGHRHATAQRHTHAKGAPIKVGLVMSSSSAQNSSGSVFLPGYQAWVASVNAHGGINGHKVKLIVKDNKENPGTSIAVVKQLVENDHVVAMVDDTDLDSVWASYIQQQHVPVVGGLLSSLEMSLSPDFFPVGQTIVSLPVSIIMAAKKIGAKKLAIFYCAESPSCQQLVGPERTLAAKNGLDLSFVAAISASAPNYTAQCLSAKQSGATALFIADAVTTTLAVAKSCVQQGYSPSLIADDGAVSKTFKTAPGFSDGMMSMQPVMPPYFPKANKGVVAMFKAFNKYQRNLVKNPNFNEIAAEGWASGLLLQAAVKGAKIGPKGEVTSAKLYKGLYTLRNETLTGISPPITFTEGAASNAQSCWFWLRTKNKQFVMPYGRKPVCAPKS